MHYFESLKKQVNCLIKLKIIFFKNHFPRKYPKTLMLFKIFFMPNFIKDISKFNSNHFKIKGSDQLIIFAAFLLLFQLYILSSCSPFRKGNDLTQFQRFEFSFRDPTTSKYFSVLFSQSDTFFLKKYSHSNKDTLFFSTLPDSGRSIINTFLININSSAFHPLKPDSIEDFNPNSARFALYIDYSDENQHVDFHSLHPPTAFKEFKNWVNMIIDNSKFDVADTMIKFKEDENIHKDLSNQDNRD